MVMLTWLVPVPFSGIRSAQTMVPARLQRGYPWLHGSWPNFIPVVLAPIRSTSNTLTTVFMRPYPRYTGDFDGDCRIDVTDCVEHFACIFGLGECAPDKCVTFDWDGDCVISLADFAEFQYALTSEDAPLPGCGLAR